MLQCFYDYFILNEKVKPCSEFDNQLFSEGRSIYEVFRIIDGIPLFYLEHIKRLFKSSEILSFDIRLDEETIKQNVQRLIEINAVRKGNVEIIFNKQNKDHSKETFLALFIENRYPIEEQYRKGIPSILFPAVRPIPNAKQVILPLREDTVEVIRKNGLYDVILLDGKGFITEGSRSNVFFINDDKIYTPPVHQILPGITREKIFEICRNHNISIQEKKIKAEDINEFEAMFFSGTSPKILPVSLVGNKVFNVKNSTLTHIIKLYNQCIDDYIQAFRKKWL